MPVSEALKINDPAGCANNMVEITPADDGVHLYRGMYIPEAGEVKFTPYGAADDTFITVMLIAGYHPIKIKRVWADTAIDVYGLI